MRAFVVPNALTQQMTRRQPRRTSRASATARSLTGSKSRSQTARDARLRARRPSASCSWSTPVANGTPSRASRRKHAAPEPPPAMTKTSGSPFGLASSTLPKAAVTALTESSTGEKSVRATRSQPQQKAAPTRRHAGVT